MTKFNSIISSNKLTLVDFFATWCGPCRMQSPIIDKVKEHYGDVVNIIKVDVDHDSEIANVYSIHSIPTLMLFKNGRVLWRASGLRQASDIESKIKEFL